MVKNIFLKTLVISMVIFAVGFFMGFVFEGHLTADLREKTQSIENSIQEIELESVYLLSVSNSSCVFLNDIVRKTNQNLDELAGQLSGFDEDKTIFSNRDLVNIKSKYTNLLVKDWLLQNSIRENCDTNSVSILYFYDKDCIDCLFQGNVLTALKQQFREKVMIFPLDHSLGVSTVELLESHYNVTSFPSLVVQDQTYKGIVPFTSLTGYVCTLISDEKCETEGQ